MRWWQVFAAMLIGHRNRNIVNLHIRNIFRRVRFEKRPCGGWRIGRIALAKQQILDAGKLGAPPYGRAVQGHVLGTFKLAYDAVMVLQVLPDTFQLMHHLNAMRLDFFSRANTTAQENLRRVNRPC